MRQIGPKSRAPAILLGSTLACALTAHPAHAGIRWENFSGYLTLTSDYRFRGVSQSDENAALQGGLDFQHDTGLFAGIWASTVEYPTRRHREDPRDVEVDYYIGHTQQWGRDWSTVLSVIRYTNPNTSVDYNYTEFAAGIGYRDRVFLNVAHTENWLGHDESATTVELNTYFPMAWSLELSATAGHSESDDLVGGGYLYGNLGLSRTWAPVTLDVRYHDTDSDAEASFGNRAGGRWVFSISAGF